MYKKIIEKLENKKIAILGFGREGKSTYNFIKKHIANPDITIIDKEDIDVDEKKIVGDNYLDNLSDFDLIIKSPGISLKDIDISNIKDKITSQLELLLEVNKNNIIGITGTKGKSTTSSLTYEVLKDQLEDVYLLGNIGVPVLDEVENYNENTKLVIEMSSHQLEFIRVSPHIAAILNLYQDHLDHDGTVTHYHQNKLNIFKYQDSDDYAIYSSDNNYLRELINDDYKGNKYTVRFDNLELDGNTTRIIDKDVFINNCLVYHDDKRNIIGDHNLKNIMFVLTISKILNLDMDRVKKVIEEFHGLKYRMEFIKNVNGVDYYNDTIATIPDATISAIKAIGNIETLIMGGLDRGIDYSGFIEYLKNSSLKNIICMPTTGIKLGKMLEKESNKNIFYADTLEDAYTKSREVTSKGGACILSPAAASYEFFKNFEEKGKAFENIVRNDN